MAIAVIGYLWYRNRNKTKAPIVGIKGSENAPSFSQEAITTSTGARGGDMRLYTGTKTSNPVGGKVSDLTNGLDVDRNTSAPTSQQIYVAAQDGSLQTSIAPTSGTGAPIETRESLSSTPTLSSTSTTTQSGTGSR